MRDQDDIEHRRTAADQYMREARFDEAAAIYAQLVEMRPEDESFRCALAWAYHDGGRREEAIACFEEILARELSGRIFTGFAFDELVRIYRELRRYERLVDICERAALSQPGDPAVLGELGDAYLQAGRTSDAVRVFRELAALEPDSPAALCRFGSACIAGTDFAEAEKAFEQAAALDPSSAGTFYERLAEEYRRVGERERETAALRASLRFDPGRPFPALRLGDILIEGGNALAGIAVYEGEIEHRRPSAGAYYNRLGNVLTDAGAHAQAAEAFRKALAAEPTNSFYRLRLADAYAHAGLPDRAAHVLAAADWKS
jgi:tetratricopeptide (TPR) repeat protein